MARLALDRLVVMSLVRCTDWVRGLLWQNLALDKPRWFRSQIQVPGM